MALIGDSQFPTELALHRKYAQSELLLNLVWTHSYIVMEIALQLLDSGRFPTQDIPRNALIQACLMFDVGTYLCDGFEFIPGQMPTGKPYSQHIITGAWLLHREGYPPSIVQAALTHAKVGFTEQDVQLYALPLPPADYSPHTAFLQLISYATKFHSKTPKFRTVAEITQALQHYGTEKVQTFQDWVNYFGEPQLTNLEAKHREWHLSMKYQLEQLRQPQGSTSLVV